MASMGTQSNGEIEYLRHAVMNKVESLTLVVFNDHGCSKTNEPFLVDNGRMHDRAAGKM